MSAPSLRRLATATGLTAAALTVAALSMPAAAAADANDFDYSSWESRYDLSLDDEGRAVMHVEETMVAEFPDHDQNKGIVYGLVTRYLDADTDTKVLSVTDAQGAAVPFWTETDGLLYVLTGTDDYVHGSTTYVIEYTMRDIMLTAEDTGVDEFYWDLLPLDSTQDIDSFRAEIAFAPELAERLNGDASCYQGTVGSTDTCDIAEPIVEADGTAVFTVSSGPRRAGDGMTVAVGFEPGTVTQPPSRQADPVLDLAPWALAGGSVASGVGGWFAISALRRRRRTATGVVIAQYEVPRSLPPLMAASLVKGARAPVPAQMVHLAVSGNLRIEDQSDRPALRRLDAPYGDPLDEHAANKIFNGKDAFTIPKSSTGFAKRMQKLEKRGVEEAHARGLLGKERSRTAMVLQWVSIVLFLGSVVLANFGSIQGRTAASVAWVGVGVAGVIMLISCFVSFGSHTVHTREGALAAEHLLGAKEFIRVAEADRLRMLQSYTGAERRSDGSIDVVHIYERLLPYAVLFGQEREWSQVLSVAYDAVEVTPSWYYGYSVSRFGSRMTRFATLTQSSAHYTPPSSSGGGGSSSFSGSSGGGFSGGGGGGGFSGGR